MAKQITIKVMGRELVVEVDDLEQLNVVAITSYMEEQWFNIQNKNKVYDTQKAAALMTFNTVKELFKLKNKQRDISDENTKMLKKLIKQVDEVNSFN